MVKHKHILAFVLLLTLLTGFLLFSAYEYYEAEDQSGVERLRDDTEADGREIQKSYDSDIFYQDKQVMTYVPKMESFAREKDMFALFCGLGCALLVFFGLCLLYLLCNIRREKTASEEQLRKVTYLLDVEKELFEAHLKPEHFTYALQKISAFLTADFSFFWLSDGFPTLRRRLWCSSGDCSGEENIKSLAAFGWMHSLLKENGTFLSYDAELLKRTIPESWRQAGGPRFRSMMLVAVKGPDGKPEMVIGACNMKTRWKDTGLLEQVAPGISGGISHYDSQLAITRMGQVDSLTGLMNRNSYHAMLENLQNRQYSTIGCVYIDVNGLHELNNRLGHVAGDGMLRTVADELKHTFFQGNIFRIGGDEFVVLCRNRTEQDVRDRAEKVRQVLREDAYELSVGVSFRNQGEDIQFVVNDAEAAMQEDKRKYYQNKGSERWMRVLDRRLEQTLLEKEDADTFLSILAPEFRGVYYVNLSNDTTRHIYIPKYFESFLQEAEDEYSRALLLYAQSIAKPEYYQDFERLCDYGQLEQQLEAGAAPELIYEKLNGDWVRVRILKLKAYTEEDKETLWIFANTKDPGINGGAKKRTAN